LNHVKFPLAGFFKYVFLVETHSIMAQARWIISSTYIVLLVIGRKGHQGIGQHCTSQTQVREFMRTSLFEKPSGSLLWKMKKKTKTEKKSPKKVWTLYYALYVFGTLSGSPCDFCTQKLKTEELFTHRPSRQLPAASPEGSSRGGQPSMDGFCGWLPL